MIMIKSNLVRGATAALTTLGLMLSAPHVQASNQAVPQKLVVQHTNAKMLDLGLQDGALLGRVVDHTGTPVANAPVVVKQGDKQVAQATTNQQGQFSVAGLKGGVYEVASGKTVGMYRVWQESAAPPAAKEQALLVLGENGERGNFGAMGGGTLIIAAIAVAALITAIIAIDQANDESESP